MREILRERERERWIIFETKASPLWLIEALDNLQAFFLMSLYTVHQKGHNSCSHPHVG